MKKTKKYLAKFFLDKHFRLLVDVVVIVSSSYLMIKKMSGFSVSAWLLANAFQQPLITAYVYISIATLIVVILSKLIMVYLDYFPPMNHNFVAPDEISNCLYRINSEVSEHLSKLFDCRDTDFKAVCEQHKFKLNLGLVADSLAEHIRKSITNIKVKKKDLFISLYAYSHENKTLEYILHYDSKRDLIETRLISLDSYKFAQYESVKCVKSCNSTTYLLDCKAKYAKGASKRHKTVSHYLGCKITSETELYGFLNIEFHNGTVFADEEEMQDFMEEHIYPFKLLLEYQFMKKQFFENLLAAKP